MEAAAELDYEGLYKSAQQLISGQQIAIAALQHELSQLRKMIFGARSERFVTVGAHPSQLTLGMTIEPPVQLPEPEEQKIEYTRKQATEPEKKVVIHPGRNPLPAHLRRDVITLEPAMIPCGAEKIGEEVTEELEYTPGELYVNRYVRPKYSRSHPEDDTRTEIIIAPLPVRALEKAIAGPGLLAQVVIDKYVDHLPLYRQLQRFERNGVKVASSTIADWIRGTCRLLDPLYGALKKEVLQSGYIHADETYIKVLDKNKKGKAHHGYLWVYNNSPGKLVFFDYQAGRGKIHPRGILEHFRGYLQTDGYVGYDGFASAEGITLMNCMAHARRKFSDALDNDRDRCGHVLKQMQVLYAIERKCREEALDHDQIKALRLSAAVPVLAELGRWMKQQYVQVLPKSPIGEALAYSIRRWDRLSLYVTDGMLSIDNNAVENSIRPVALGRKNYLFCGSDEGARRAAMLYSLLGTCKLHQVNPFDWLQDVLSRISEHRVSNIKELLPQNWLRLQS